MLSLPEVTSPAPGTQALAFQGHPSRPARVVRDALRLQGAGSRASVHMRVFTRVRSSSVGCGAGTQGCPPAVHYETWQGVDARTFVTCPVLGSLCGQWELPGHEACFVLLGDMFMNGLLLWKVGNGETPVGRIISSLFQKVSRVEGHLQQLTAEASC